MSNQFFEVSAPSNIALLKYWGKRNTDHQWPSNNSLSLTLTLSQSKTTARKHESDEHLFYFQNELYSKEHSFAKKVYQYLDILEETFQFNSKLIIESKNTFPSASGIASSASGMAALTIASLAAWT